VCNIEFFWSNNHMFVIYRTQWFIPTPTVGSNASARRHMLFYEVKKALGRCIMDAFEPDPTDTLTVILLRLGFVFNGNDHKCFVLCSTATFARPFTTYVGFIDLDSSVQLIAIWANHSPSEPVKPFPRSMVTPKAKNSLKPQRIGSVFLGCYVPHGLKPQSHGLSAVVENGTRSHRSLASTFLAQKEPAVCLPCLSMSTFRAAEPRRPPKQCQVFEAGIVGSEVILEFDGCSRVIFHGCTLAPTSGGVKCIPTLLYFMSR